MTRPARWILTLAVLAALGGCANRLPTATETTGGVAAAVAGTAGPRGSTPCAEPVRFTAKQGCVLDPCDPCAGGRCSVPR